MSLVIEYGCELPMGRARAAEAARHASFTGFSVFGAKYRAAAAIIAKRERHCDGGRRIIDFQRSLTRQKMLLACIIIIKEGELGDASLLHDANILHGR